MKLFLKIFLVGVGSVVCLMLVDTFRLTPHHAELAGFVWGVICLSSLRWLDNTFR